VIYPLDRIIHLSNNLGLGNRNENLRSPLPHFNERENSACWLFALVHLDLGEARSGFISHEKLL